MLHTIGHSVHNIEAFLSLLKLHKMDTIIDVRTNPFSKVTPQFNRNALLPFLKQNNIMYSHFPEEFGARRLDKSLLDEEGRVDFEKIRQTENFKDGIKKVKSGLEKGRVIALLCAEADPFDCHRFAMISYQFVKDGIEVHHILKDGACLTNQALEAMLLKKYAKKLPQGTLFEPEPTDREKLDYAYRLRNRDIAYTASEAN